MLQLHSLSYAYPGHAPLSFPDWSLKPGEAAVLAGPSGCGKSTLLLLIAGLLTPAGGRVTLGCKNIGVVLQSFRLLEQLTVLENLTLAQYLSGRKVDRAAARDALAALDIGTLANRLPRQLSRGQVQRAAIARAVVNEPQLLLADEPTSSLDDDAAEAALDLLLRESQRLGATLLLATHDSRVKARIPKLFDLKAVTA